jgi:hypothetical protein
MSAPKSSWLFRIIAFVCFALVFAIYCSAINPELSDLSGDSARYLLLAKSISQGKGFREIEKPGDPSHSEYMPGLPVLLAPIDHFRPGELRPMKFLVAVFAFSSVVFFYFFLFRLPRPAALLLALCFSLLPFLLSFQTMILADLPHLAFLFLAFYFFEKTRDAPEQNIWRWVAAGILTALAFYFRQIALIAFASGLAVILIDKRLRKIKIFFGYGLGFLLPASVWYLRNIMVAGSIEPSYGKKLFYAKASDPFAGTLGVFGLTARIFRRIEFFGYSLSKDMLLGLHGVFFSALWVLLLIFLSIGLVRELIRRKNIAAIYFIPYLAAISSWEGWVPRYLLPLLPLALFFILQGVSFAASMMTRKDLIGKWIAGLIFVLWLALSLVRGAATVDFQHTPLPYPPNSAANEKEAVSLLGPKNFAFYPDAYEWKKRGTHYLSAKSATYYHFFAMAEWTQKNLTPDQVVVCRKPTLFAWQSRGKSVQYPPELEVDKFLDEVKQRGGNYILIEEISPELRPVLLSFWNNRPEQLKLVKQIGDTFLLSLQPQ